MAITGLLIPFVGYINRRLRVASQLGANTRPEAGVARVISDKVPVHKLSHLEHRDDLLAIKHHQQLFVCADVALILGILELVFANVLPKLFGQFGPGKWVFSDHCGKCGVGLHGFAKGVFGSGGFLGVGIGQLERAGLGCQAKKSTVLPRSSRERSCSWYFQSQCHPRWRSRPQRQPGVQQSVVVSIKSKAPQWVGWKSGGSFHGTSFGQIDVRGVL